MALSNLKLEVYMRVLESKDVATVSGGVPALDPVAGGIAIVALAVMTTATAGLALVGIAVIGTAVAAGDA